MREQRIYWIVMLYARANAYVKRKKISMSFITIGFLRPIIVMFEEQNVVHISSIISPR